MSRIGKSPVILLKGVSVSQNANTLVVKGDKGELSLQIPLGLKVVVKDDNVIVETDTNMQQGHLHGTIRSLVNNAVIGVTQGWEKKIELVGVGYRAQGGGKELTLIVGFSHPVKITAPEGITFQISDNTKIAVSGIDKKTVGEMAAKIRKIKPPEPYKGKGIRYAGEVIRKKAGKAVKAAGAAA